MAVTVIAHVNSGFAPALAKITSAWMVNVLPTGSAPAFGNEANSVSDPRSAPHAGVGVERAPLTKSRGPQMGKLRIRELLIPKNDVHTVPAAEPHRAGEETARKYVPTRSPRTETAIASPAVAVVVKGVHVKAAHWQPIAAPLAPVHVKPEMSWQTAVALTITMIAIDRRSDDLRTCNSLLETRSNDHAHRTIGPIPMMWPR